MKGHPIKYEHLFNTKANKAWIVDYCKLRKWGLVCLK
jgi:hypothetical protein